MAKLNALTIQRPLSAGLYSDGNGLYLQVSKTGSKSWIFRFMIGGKARSMGLGSLKVLSLSEARVKAINARLAILNGQDPISLKAHQRSKLAQDKARSMTFAQCASAYIAAHEPSWRNPKHRQQWTNTIAAYAKPVFGDVSVSDVDTTLVLKALEPIWLQKTETASRLRGRIEKILGWAAVRGYRTAENPARWTGHLENLLPKKSSVKKTSHFKAMQVSDLGHFMQRLRARGDMSDLALEFVILTTTRTNETLKARWEEFNIEQQMWIIPAERMKTKKEHRVPLTARMIEILHHLKDRNRCNFVFASPRKNGTHLSDMSLLKVLRSMDLDVTTHGFRSTFSDWSAEKTNYPREVVEMQLAHAISNKVEAAYRRGDLFLKRRSLLNDWEKFCGAVQTSVTRTIENRENLRPQTTA